MIPFPVIVESWLVQEEGTHMELNQDDGGALRYVLVCSH